MEKMMRPIVLLAAVTLFTGGCTHFPYGMSLDKHNFVSTPHMPLTLTLVDTYSGDTVWSLDVPVNKMAVVNFDHSDHWTAAQPAALPAKKIKWDIFEPDRRYGFLKNEQKLSGNPVLLKVSIREKGDEEPAPRNKAGDAETNAARLNERGAPRAAADKSPPG